MIKKYQYVIIIYNVGLIESITHRKGSDTPKIDGFGKPSRIRIVWCCQS